MRKMRVAVFAATTIAGGALGVVGSRLLDAYTEAEVRQDVASVEACERGEQSLERGRDGLLYCSGVRVYEVPGDVSELASPDYLRTYSALSDREWNDPVSEVAGAVGLGATGAVLFDAALAIFVTIHEARQRAERNRGGVIRGSVI
jgi:hypothetical protein